MTFTAICVPTQSFPIEWAHQIYPMTIFVTSLNEKTYPDCFLMRRTVIPCWSLLHHVQNRMPTTLQEKKRSKPKEFEDMLLTDDL